MFLNKKRVKVEKILFPIIYMVLYRTKVGLKLMDTIAKRHPTLVGIFAFLSVVIGFIGMALIIVMLVKGVYAFLFAGAPPPIAPLLPGVKTVPGLPDFGFFHWILAIFILAGVHEFSHGLVARLYNVTVKSSGFAVFSFVLPIIPAAFVEPDEKELGEKTDMEQLGVLGAGSFSNLLTAGVFFVLFSFVFAPLVSSITVSEGVIILDVVEGGPAGSMGVEINEKVLGINGNSVENVRGFVEQLRGLEPGDIVELETDSNSYNVVTGDREGKAFVGLSFGAENQYIEEKYRMFGGALSWFAFLMFWVFAANLGVGLFNLLPMGPLDGGKMFYIISHKIFKKKRMAKKVWLGFSFFCLALIVISLLPFLGRLLNFIFGLITGVF
jgi:membrane-associated protease RseP (regulator of RpoE activity)